MILSKPLVHDINIIKCESEGNKNGKNNHFPLFKAFHFHEKEKRIK